MWSMTDASCFSIFATRTALRQTTMRTADWTFTPIEIQFRMSFISWKLRVQRLWKHGPRRRDLSPDISGLAVVQ
jgi:hypothetical protein